MSKTVDNLILGEFTALKKICLAESVVTEERKIQEENRSK